MKALTWHRILRHEAMGIVEETGSDVAHFQVVVPFNISCGRCYMCDRHLYAQCETTQVRKHGTGASLFGYTELYGSVPGGQAKFLRVPQAHFGPIAVPGEHPDERFLYLSDVLPIAWQVVEYAGVPTGGSVAVVRLGPVRQFCARIARRPGTEKVFGIDRVPKRLALAARYGVDAIESHAVDDLPAVLRDRTLGRGPDAVIDAVGIEAPGRRSQPGRDS